MPNERKDRKLPIGYPVQFFHAADANQEPQAAVITKCNEQGLADLVVIPAGGGEVMAKRTVRHVADPWLRDHPQAARNNGGWDYVPGLPHPSTGEKSRREYKAELEQRIVELHEGGKSPAQIAQSIKQPGVNQERIELFLVKTGRIEDPRTKDKKKGKQPEQPVAAGST